MKSKKITAAVLGIVLTFGLVVSGCGNNNGASSDGSAKAETNKDGYEVVSIGFPSAGYEWAEGALAVAEEKGYLDEYLNPLGYDADLIPFTGAAPAIHEALVSGFCVSPSPSSWSRTASCSWLSPARSVDLQAPHPVYSKDR